MKQALLKNCVLAASMALVCSTARADFSDVWTAAPSPWSATPLETSEIPDGVSVCQYTTGVSDSNPHTLHKAETTVVATATTATITFTYSSGSHMLMIAGVDVVASDGTTVISDYHEGKAGGSHSNNVYTLNELTTGETYTLRYFVCNKQDTGSNDHNITLTNGNIAVTGLINSELIADAKAAYACSGPGYPTAESSVRTTLGSCIDAAEADGMTEEEHTALTTALTAFKTSSDIQLPEDGKAYKIANYSLYNGGTTRYLQYTAGEALAVSGDINQSEADIFIFKKLNNGKYAIITEDGKILTWMHPSDGYAENGTHYGYSSSYGATYSNYSDWNDITIKKNGTEETDFGYLRMVGARSSSTQSSFIINGSTGGWDRADDSYWFQSSGSYFSSAWCITEVADYEVNEAQLEAVKAIAKTQTGTISPAVCDYTCTIDGEEVSDAETVEAAIDAATTIEAINEIVESAHINLPESGKYYRLQGISGNYIDAVNLYNTSTGQMGMKSAEERDEEGSIFYLDSQKRLKNLSTGTYIHITCQIGETKENANTWTFAEYVKTPLSGYITLTANQVENYGYELHDNSGNCADRCTSICSDRHAWKLEEVEVKMEARIGADDEYKTLGAAFAAVNDEETITLLSDVTFTAETAYNGESYYDGMRYTGDKSFTVDFAGFTVTDDGCVDDYVLYILNSGEKANEITFSNGTVKSKSGCWSTVCVGSASATQPTVLNLNGMTIENSNDTDYNGNLAVRVRGEGDAASTINVNTGTTITSDGASYGIASLSAGAKVNINSGATVAQKNSGTSGGNSVFTAVGALGTVNIADGATITSDRFGVHTLTSGNAAVNIAGGTITAETALCAATNGGEGQTAVISVTDGTIMGELSVINSGSSIVLTGGSYDRDVTDFCASGYECVAASEDGRYNVQAKQGTSISEVESAHVTEAAIYDLSGRRVVKVAKGGLYIVGGKKVLVK